MYENDSEISTRRSVITGMGAAAAGIAMGAAGPAQAQQTATNFKPGRHDEDAWMNEIPGDHRVFIDCSRPLGGAEGMLYAHNILTAHTGGYNGDESDYAMIVCFRRFATPFGWSDSIWEKYGAILNNVLQFPDPATEEPFDVNPMTVTGRRDIPNMSNTIDSLGERGVKFDVCAGATRVISGLLARATNSSADETYQELVDSLVPNGRFVPAGVMAATRAQEFGYSLLYAGL